MDSFRKPEMIIGIICLVAIIGVVIYFYIKLGAQQEALDKHNERLSAAIKKLTEMPQMNVIQQIAERFKVQERIMEEQRKTIESQGAELERLGDLVDIMSSHLESQGVKIRPSCRRREKKTTRLGSRAREPDSSEEQEATTPECNLLDMSADEAPTPTRHGKRGVSFIPSPPAATKEEQEEDELERSIAATRAARAARAARAQKGN